MFILEDAHVLLALALVFEQASNNSPSPLCPFPGFRSHYYNFIVELITVGLHPSGVELCLFEKAEAHLFDKVASAEDTNRLKGTLKVDWTQWPADPPPSAIEDPFHLPGVRPPLLPACACHAPSSSCALQRVLMCPHPFRCLLLP